jgi:transcriptional/translational regulatory protein YebC/TACO1
MKVMLNTYVKKYNSTFTEGAIPGLFDHKGLIEAMPPEKTPLETAVEHAIEAGAEDVIELQDTEDSGLQFVCSPMALNQVRGKLEKLQYTIRAADCEFIPKMQVTLNDADLDTVKKLCDKLAEIPDVVRLYDNIA